MPRRSMSLVHTDVRHVHHRTFPAEEQAHHAPPDARWSVIFLTVAEFRTRIEVSVETHALLLRVWPMKIVMMIRLSCAVRHDKA